MEKVIGPADTGGGILAIGELLALAGTQLQRDLLAELSRFTGVVVAGAAAKRARGTIVAVIDPGSDVALLVDTAERLAWDSREEVVLLLVSDDERETERLEREACEALDETTRFRIEKLGAGSVETVCDLVRQVNAGLTIARFGGPVAEDVPCALRIVCALDCPLLLLGGQIVDNATGKANNRK